jgi:hypothetical protein
MDAEQLVFARRHRVSLDTAQGGDAVTQARQLDAVLMSAGFKLSADLLRAMSVLDPSYVIDRAVEIIGWARELAGDHVRHNTYFIDFPANVPDTAEFWADCLREAVIAGGQVRRAAVLSRDGLEFFTDLLSLPGYGRYRHLYEEMLARHDELIPLMTDRMTVIHRGGPAAEEAAGLYAELAGSAAPLSGEGLAALRVLAEACPGGVLEMPVRENRAVVNAVRVRAGIAPSVTTVTDILRLAAELSGSDVTLAKPPRFRSLPRGQRHLLMQSLDGITPGSDVVRHREQWKRLGERLHPHEYPQYPVAQLAFAAARGEEEVMTFAGKAEQAFRRGDTVSAAKWLSVSPGMLWRSADRLLRTADPRDVSALIGGFTRTAPDASARVLLSAGEHLVNRVRKSDVSRIFTGKGAHAWVAPDRRPLLDLSVVADLSAVIDAEISRRLPEIPVLALDPAVLDAAVPLSGKGISGGLGVWPRGSVVPLPPGDTLRFFCYWKQRSRRTDYDLSALFTDEQFANSRHVSWTRLREMNAVHSGDIVSAEEGATEFIDISLAGSGRGYIIPQVYIYAGEGFDEVEESFFGFMTRQSGQQGAPFEARTVRMKSALCGGGRVAMPLVFFRGEDGRFYAKWLHLNLKGQGGFSGGGARVEDNRLTTRLLARSVMERDYLRVGYLAGLMAAKAGAVFDGRDELPDQPVTYLGVAEREGLPEGSDVITLADLARLIPG